MDESVGILVGVIFFARRRKKSNSASATTLTTTMGTAMAADRSDEVSDDEEESDPSPSEIGSEGPLLTTSTIPSLSVPVELIPLLLLLLAGFVLVTAPVLLLLI